MKRYISPNIEIHTLLFANSTLAGIDIHHSEGFHEDATNDGFFDESSDESQKTSLFDEHKKEKPL